MPLLGHPEEFDLAHRAFGLSDGLSHRRDSSLRFLNRPFERLTFLGDDGQQLLAEALHPPFAGVPNELTTGTFNQAIERRKQLSPIPFRPAIFKALRGADFKDRAHAALQSFSRTFIVNAVAAALSSTVVRSALFSTRMR